jgi:outer membrane protein OmpA-like peptidoglycan-associated protein
MGGLMAGLVMASPTASAEDVILFKNVPSAEEVNNVLFGKGDAATEGLRTRSIRVINPADGASDAKTRAIRMHNPDAGVAAVTPVAVEAEDAAVSGPEPAAAPSGVGLGFNLQFAFDSVELLPDSQPYIDRLGEVLGSPDNAGKQLLIIGHTDASGADSYNAQLSERRAVAVRDYLATSWNIDVSLLQIQGAGESQPLEGTDPLDGINRRVEFFALN